ncbi:unnamed protein product [Thelazia callipaeda]|uniref:TPR_REGION domain-containing protein n=1 Tax=Thelazia callipaeda TaxID=103827 RepID=A0A0N5CSR1_THECL|nr:unnamed protein product [Thelazia callipaeda]
MIDRYEGFNDYNYAYDAQNVLEDQVFQQAVARSSYGRRPRTSSAQLGNIHMKALSTPISQRVFGSGMVQSPLALHCGAEPSRPITAIRGAGYTSSAQGTFNPLKMTIMEKTAEVSDEEKCRQMEKKVNELLKDSIFAWEKGDMKKALEKAKEAGRRERAVVKIREQLSSTEHLNLDLTFTVLFNLAHQYMANSLLTEALITYQVVVRNKMFSNASRLKANMANVYFKKKEYKKAIKFYQIALDHIPSSQKHTRAKIMNNIGVAFVKCGEYEEASSIFEHCMDEKGNYKTALNSILTAFCLNDVDKMKDGFQRLLDIPLLVDDEAKYIVSLFFFIHKKYLITAYFL